MGINLSLYLDAVDNGGILDLSPTSIQLAIIAVSRLHKRYLWHNDDESLTDTEWDSLDANISLCLDELMSSLTGLIVPAIFATPSNSKFLPCDGSVYNRVDYPALYDSIDSVYLIDADTFRVPDFRDRAVVGAGGSYAVDNTFGVDSVALTVSELPAHTHTYGYPSVGVDIEGAGVPDVTAVSNPPAQLQTSAVGGNAAHENRQPSIAVNWYVIA